jgi:hypothetical protein
MRRIFLLKHNQSFLLLTVWVAVLCWCTGTYGAKIHEKAGTHAMAFLKIGVGAKAIGMGESQAADANDLYASYWNPAGLANIQRPQLGLMHNEWFAGINHEFIGFVQPIGNAGVIGGSAVYLSSGELQGRDAKGQETKIFRPYDIALILSYARRFGSGVSFGMNTKWVRSQIDDTNAQVVAFDIGGLYVVPKSSLAFGFSAQHLGTKAKFVEESFSLPLNIRVGAAYKLLNDALTITTDVNRPSDNDPTIGFGTAYSISNVLHLRTGYKYSLGGNDLGFASGITTGFGFTITGFELDYAFVSFGKLGPVHRFSLISSF